MAEEGEIVKVDFETDSGSDDDDDDYYVAPEDFDENEALTNGVMMGLEWDAVKQMMYNGFGHLLAQGYPSPESYMEHMREKEKHEQRNRQPSSVAPPVSDFGSFAPSPLHFPPLNGPPFNGPPHMVVPLTIPIQEMSFRGGRGRGRGNRGGNRGSVRNGRIRGSRKKKYNKTRKDFDHMNLANEDCRFYLAGSCSKGTECTYRHCAEAKNTSAICESWQADSKCNEPTKCKFLHPTKQPEAKTCHFFTRGICKNGSSCKFLHIVEDEKPTEEINNSGNQITNSTTVQTQKEETN